MLLPYALYLLFKEYFFLISLVPFAGAGAPRASDADHPLLPGAPPQLCAQERRPRHLHHLQELRLPHPGRARAHRELPGGGAGTEEGPPGGRKKKEREINFAPVKEKWSCFSKTCQLM